MNEFIYYLSPVLALAIFVGIAAFVKIRSGKVKVVGYDYLRFNNFLNKFRARFRKLNLSGKIQTLKKLLYNLYEKFVRKVRVEALKMQVWADKTLEKHKERKNGNV